MGLGLHGGGVVAARFLVSAGCDVTVTDLRSERALARSLEELSDVGERIRTVLGRHEDADFADADFVVKNPAVPRHSTYLEKARRIETDISLFLAGRHLRGLSGPLIAVTGTKGKSTTAKALNHGLRRSGYSSYLGGNITISPLTFLERLSPDDPVVLELSSFQLGDLLLVPGGPATVLKPQLGIITSFFRDHQDYYGSMDRYFADKAILAESTDPAGALIIGASGEYGERFAARSQARVFPAAAPPVGAPLPDGRSVLLEDAAAVVRDPDRSPKPAVLPLPSGIPASAVLELNLGMTLAALYLLGVDEGRLAAVLEDFPGVEHRLESCGAINGVAIYNDSAATVPEASLEAVKSLACPVHLIAGGTDKRLDYALFAEVRREAASLCLLEGSATEKMLSVLSAADPDGTSDTPLLGPFPDLQECLGASLARAKPGEAVVFSPGCASFEKFDNEFHRGRVFKALVAAPGGEF